MGGQVILIEDDPDVRFLIEELLKKEGVNVISFESFEEASSSINESSDLVIMDVKLPGVDGISAIEKIRGLSSCPIILMSAYGTRKNLIDAIKKGAYDFFIKPISVEEFRVVVRRALKKMELERELKKDEKKKFDSVLFHGIVGASSSMKEVFRVVEKIAKKDINVLLCGETGVGKEAIAMLIHKLSDRKGSFVPVNCASLPDPLLESELFGYEKGAFTGASTSKKGKAELAENGTLFLDEIAEMSDRLQAKLLRFVETKELERLGGIERKIIDVRIISATNRDVEKEIRDGRFRKDLYYRLSGITIKIPPLRERREDIPYLIDYFLSQLENEGGKKLEIAETAKERLLSYLWPGNVRELKAVLSSASAICEDGLIKIEDLPLHIVGDEGKGLIHHLPLDKSIEEMEKMKILEALKKTKGNQRKAAQILGISERSMWYRIKKYGICSKEMEN